MPENPENAVDFKFSVSLGKPVRLAEKKSMAGILADRGQICLSNITFFVTSAYANMGLK